MLIIIYLYDRPGCNKGLDFKLSNECEITKCSLHPDHKRLSLGNVSENFETMIFVLKWGKFDNTGSYLFHAVWTS